MKGAIIVIAIVVILFLWACMRNSSDISRQEEEKERVKLDPLKSPFEKKIRVIQTYFFGDKGFSFEKFCDYILCIREDEHRSKYLEYLAELELFVTCCEGLGPKLLNILLEEKSIVVIAGTEPEFILMKQYIREGKFKGTYGDLCYILFTTVFYLKNKIRTNEQS